MKGLLGVLITVFLMGLFTDQAFAGSCDVGYIEICKAPNPALHGMFRFQILDVRDPIVDVEVGTCTPPIPVVPGKVIVTELGSLSALGDDGNLDSQPSTAFLAASISAVGPTGPLPGAQGFTYVADVPPSPGGTQNVVTLTYENQLVTGVVEVCKAIVPGSGLTGSWSFVVKGSNSFNQVVTAPTGACSAPVTVPAGKVLVQELGTAVAVVDISANKRIRGTLPGPPPAPDLATGAVVVEVEAGDASQQTIVTMVDTSVRLKLCKYVDPRLMNPGPYSFTFTTRGEPGPNGPIAPVSLLVSKPQQNPVCTVVGTYRAGTTVGITEGVVPGSKVGSITVDPPDRAYALDLANRTATVVLGRGETVVTYADIPALPGKFKLCKVADPSPPPIPPGTIFNFTVSDGASVQQLAIPAGSCAMVLTYPFNTTLSVVEAPVTNVRVQAIKAVPSMVAVIVDGVTVSTNQPVLTNQDLAGRAVSVTIGENNITELTYVNVDPPPVSAGARRSAATTVVRPTGQRTTARAAASAPANSRVRGTTAPTGYAALSSADIQRAIAQARDASYRATLAKLGAQ